jgi:hypothetical protein
VSTAYDDSFYKLAVFPCPPSEYSRLKMPLSLAASHASSNSIDRCGSSLCPTTTHSSASQIHDCLREIRRSFRDSSIATVAVLIYQDAERRSGERTSVYFLFSRRSRQKSPADNHDWLLPMQCGEGLSFSLSISSALFLHGYPETKSTVGN